MAGEEINYRRFFDINELAAIRMEDPDVFAETHRLVFRLVGAGQVTGLRVDHPDGLYAPAEYFQKLQRECARAPRAPDGEGRLLHRRREDPEPRRTAARRTGPSRGTTGYEFLNLLNGIFVDRSQARAMEHLYARLHQGAAALLGGRLRMQAARHADVDGLGAEHARAPAERHLREASLLP